MAAGRGQENMEASYLPVMMRIAKNIKLFVK